MIGNKLDLVKEDTLRGMTEKELKLIQDKKWEHIKVSCLSRERIGSLW